MIVERRIRDVLAIALSERREQLTGEAEPLDYDGARFVLAALEKAGMRITDEPATGPGDAVLARLRAAEDVVVMWSWTGSTAGPQETDREKAVFELWQRWRKVGGSSDPKDNPHLTDELVAELAAQRDATRKATLKHFFGPEVER